MAEEHEKDRQIHENLQRISQHLIFPKQPTEEKRDQWQALIRENRHEPSIVARGAYLMKRHKTLTMIGSGALAASMLLAVLFVSTTTPRVSAGIILKDLRLALGKSILIEFQNIEVNYADLATHIPTSQLQRGTVTLSGSVFVPNRPTQEAFWMMKDIHMRDLSVFPDSTAGFSADAELTACLRDEKPWFFFQASGASALDAAEFGPQAAVLRTLWNGVYVKLPSLAFETQGSGGVRYARIVSPEFSNLRDLQRVLGRLEEIASEIAIDEVDDGSFILTASGFHDGVALPVPEGTEISPTLRSGMDGWLREQMTNQVVEVGYRPGEGVRWISVRHFGTGDATIDIQVGDIGFDESLLDLDYQVARRPAPVLDASSLLSLVDMFDRAAEDKSK